MNIIKEMKKEFGTTVVSRESGELEIYFSGDDALKNKIFGWLSMKSLVQCFTKIHFITV